MEIGATWEQDGEDTGETWEGHLPPRIRQCGRPELLPYLAQLDCLLDQLALEEGGIVVQTFRVAARRCAVTAAVHCLHEPRDPTGLAKTAEIVAVAEALARLPYHKQQRISVAVALDADKLLQYTEDGGRRDAATPDQITIHK